MIPIKTSAARQFSADGPHSFFMLHSSPWKPGWDAC